MDHSVERVPFRQIPDQIDDRKVRLVSVVVVLSDAAREGACGHEDHPEVDGRAHEPSREGSGFASGTAHTAVAESRIGVTVSSY